MSREITICGGSVFPWVEPEQITSGPTEEDGLAVAPDGRSLITSIGMRQSAVWIHDLSRRARALFGRKRADGEEFRSVRNHAHVFERMASRSSI